MLSACERALETIASEHDGRFREARGWTSIFIYPGYTFRAIDGMITNFHLPKSSLIMLVSALAGREHVLSAYRTAVEHVFHCGPVGGKHMLSACERADKHNEGRFRKMKIGNHPVYCPESVAGIDKNRCPASRFPEAAVMLGSDCLKRALAGREHVLSAYRTAVEHEYRFFSFGDAMLIK